MIRDRKGGPWSWLIGAYIARKVRTSFRGVWVRGARPPSDHGLLVYANHSSFWDGFVMHQLGALCGWNAFALMEEANLAKYPFHTRIGAFSIRRNDSASALETLRYAQTVLRRPRAVVVIFPQGEIRPAAAPLGELSRGAAVLARAAKVPSVAVALRYVFFEDEYPDVLVEFGTPHPPGPLAVFERELAAVHDRLFAATSTDGFDLALRGRRSIQHRWDDARRPWRLSDSSTPRLR